MTKKILVALSGGMDSATVLAMAVDYAGPSNVWAMGFNYGSKHGPYEQRAAIGIAAYYGVRMTIVDLTDVGRYLKSNLLLYGGEIPEGHYQAESMKQTVVPGRNTIFAGILAGAAQSNGIQEIWMGVHSGDHHIYPDCRPDWFYAMKNVIETASEQSVTIKAPFLNADKVQILRTGYPLGVPYQLTRTCYKDQMLACGKCGSCQERLEAFSRVRDLYDRDPLNYVPQTTV